MKNKESTMPPLILVHVPGISWQCIMDDNAAPLLPTFLKLLEQGTSGSLPAVGHDPVMDGIIMTGIHPSQNGLLTRHSDRPDGFGGDTTSSMHLRNLTLSQHLDHYRYRCACINMKASNFLQLEHGVVVSNIFTEVRAKHASTWGVPPGSISPLEISDTYADLRVHPEELIKEQIYPFLANNDTQVAEKNIKIIAKVLSENSSVHAIATDLLANDEFDFISVTYPALSQLNPHFPKAENLSLGEGTAWQFMTLLDAFIARLLMLADKNATIFITGGTELQPFWIANGPLIDPDKLFPKETSLYDFVPTILANYGVDISEFTGVKRINIFENSVFTKKLLKQKSKFLPSVDSIVNDLIASGFTKTKPTLEQEQSLKMSSFRKHFSLAENYRYAGELVFAINEYVNALNIIPDDTATILRICNCFLDSGQYIEARNYFDRIPDERESNFEIKILEAYIFIVEKKMDHASQLAQNASSLVDRGNKKITTLINLHKKLQTIFLASKMPEKAQVHKSEVIKIKQLHRV